MKFPLLRRFPFISKLKAGDIITTGQCLNFETFSQLQFGWLLKNSFHSIHIDLRDTSGEKNPLYLSVSLVLFCCSENLAEGIQVYSTMSNTEAAFAERTIRSLKNILYRYMEDFGYKYIHKLLQVITTLNSRRNRSIDMRPNIERIATLCLFFTVNLCGNSRNLHSKFVIECESQSMTCLFAKVTSRSLHEKFLKL